MGTPVLAGRDFDARDRLGAPPVVIVNEALARKFFNGASPLGKYYRLVEHDSLSSPIQIVGVVKDAKYKELREESLPTAYLPLSQDSAQSPYANYVLRTVGAPSSLAPGVKAVVAEVNRSIALELTPLSDQVDQSLARERLLATLSGFFGALALLLATIGLYGTLSYSVARRRNEIGVRIALGAGQERVMRLVLGEVVRLIVVGVTLGVVAAVFGTRVMTSFLFGLSASDPATVIGATTIMAVVGLAAGALPAWRAARVDPIAALAGRVALASRCLTSRQPRSAMGRYRRFVNVLRPNRVSADIQRELEFHMAERADELMAAGMSEVDARREARRRFGNAGVQKERTRDADLLTWLESLGGDVRYAWRALRASPGFALVAILSLGLGIGANTAIFSLLNAVVLRTLPVERPDELLQVTMGGDGAPPGASEFTNPIWEQIRDRQDVFSGAFAYGGAFFNLRSGGEVRNARGSLVSGDLLLDTRRQARGGPPAEQSGRHSGLPAHRRAGVWILAE